MATTNKSSQRTKGFYLGQNGKTLDFVHARKVARKVAEEFRPPFEIGAPLPDSYFPFRFGGTKYVGVDFIKKCFAKGLIGVDSHIIKDIMPAIRDCCENSSPVLITGESGTGKEVVELQVDAYPLGIRANATYEAIETQLEPGDRVVFCSDGIVEAGNTAGEIFGFERTLQTIRQGCQEGLSAEALLERIIAEVKAFAGEEPQGDDQTIVVLHVEA